MESFDSSPNRVFDAIDRHDPEVAGVQIGSVSQEESLVAYGNGGSQTGATLPLALPKQDLVDETLLFPNDADEPVQPLEQPASFAPRTRPLPIFPEPASYAAQREDCLPASCQGVVYASDLKVLFVSTGATWPALPGPAA